MSLAGTTLGATAINSQLGFLRDPNLSEETGVRSQVSFPNSDLDYTSNELIDEVWDHNFHYTVHADPFGKLSSTYLSY